MPLNLPISLILGDEEIEGTIMNVSLGGFFVKVDQGLDKDTKVKVSFVLRAGEELCKAHGRVTWRSEFGAGVALTWTNEPFVAFVKRLAVVAQSPRAKKELLESLLFPPQIEAADGRASF